MPLLSHGAIGNFVQPNRIVDTSSDAELARQLQEMELQQVFIVHVN